MKQLARHVRHMVETAVLRRSAASAAAGVTASSGTSAVTIDAGRASARLLTTAAPAESQAAALPMTSMRRVISVIQVDSTGAISELKTPITKLKEESHLHMRELLLVEANLGSLGAKPRILPRRHCIVLTIGTVRSIIFTDRVYLFGSLTLPGVRDYADKLSLHIKTLAQSSLLSMAYTPGSAACRPLGPEHVAALATSAMPAGSGSSPTPNGGHDGASLLRALAHGSASLAGTAGAAMEASSLPGTVGHGAASAKSAASSAPAPADKESTPFELTVMEHALLHQARKQGQRVGYLQTLLDRTLAKLVTVERDESNLASLFPIANTVSHYDMVTRGICECIRALLDDDRDMREACLSEKRRYSEETARQIEFQEKLRISETILGQARARLGTSVQDMSPEARLLAEDVAAAADTAAGAAGANGDQSMDGGGGAVPGQQSHAAAGVHVPAAQRWKSASGVARALPAASAAAFASAAHVAEAAARLLQPDSHSGIITHASGLHEESILRSISADALSQLELMLESVYHQAAEVNVQTVEMARTIKTKQDQLELQQSNYRNWILTVTLQMSMISVGLTTANFVTSAFGQNLVSGLETIPGLFYLSSAVAAGAGYRAWSYLVRYTKDSPTQRYARHLQALTDFLYRIDSKVAAARATVSAATNASMPMSSQLGRADAMTRESLLTGPGAAAAAAADGSRPETLIDHLERAVGQQSGAVPTQPLPTPARLSHHEFAGGDSVGVSARVAAAGNSEGSVHPRHHGNRTEASSASRFNEVAAGTAAGSVHPVVSPREHAMLRPRSLTKSEFKEWYNRMNGANISDEEVDILFELFDVDSDGKLRLQEVADITRASSDQLP